MNIALWIVQILLAVVFLLHGRLMFSPPASQQSGMAYILAIPIRLRRLIGIAEILAAIGLVLPALNRLSSLVYSAGSRRAGHPPSRRGDLPYPPQGISQYRIQPNLASTGSLCRLWTFCHYPHLRNGSRPCRAVRNRS